MPLTSSTSSSLTRRKKKKVQSPPRVYEYGMIFVLMQIVLTMLAMGLSFLPLFTCHVKMNQNFVSIISLSVTSVALLLYFAFGYYVIKLSKYATLTFYRTRAIGFTTLWLLCGIGQIAALPHYSSEFQCREWNVLMEMSFVLATLHAVELVVMRRWPERSNQPHSMSKFCSETLIPLQFRLLEQQIKQKKKEKVHEKPENMEWLEKQWKTLFFRRYLQNPAKPNVALVQETKDDSIDSNKSSESKSKSGSAVALKEKPDPDTLEIGPKEGSGLSDEPKPRKDKSQKSKKKKKPKPKP